MSNFKEITNILQGLAPLVNKIAHCLSLAGDEFIWSSNYINIVGRVCL